MSDKKNNDQDNLEDLSNELEENISELDELQKNFNLLQIQLSKANEEIVDLKQQLLYKVAEEENIRKRNLKQLDETKKFAVASFSKEMIDVLENLYLATENIPEDLLKANETVNSIFQGVEMTKSSLLNIFSKHGITRIYPSIGDSFDHNIHEAVTYVDDNQHADNSIVSVMRAGYMIHDRLIKPAMVVIAKAKS